MSGHALKPWVPAEAPAATSESDLSGAIVQISDGMKKLLKSGLNRDAIVVLLQDATKVSRTDIRAVLSGLEDLKKKYTK